MRYCVSRKCGFSPLDGCASRSNSVRNWPALRSEPNAPSHSRNFSLPRLPAWSSSTPFAPAPVIAFIRLHRLPPASSPHPAAAPNNFLKTGGSRATSWGSFSNALFTHA